MTEIKEDREMKNFIAKRTDNGKWEFCSCADYPSGLFYSGYIGPCRTIKLAKSIAVELNLKLETIPITVNDYNEAEKFYSGA